MRYSSRLKGSITQSLVRALLTDAGLSVLPLGIEEVVPNVTELDAKTYRSLNLPPQLRLIPDFFVANSQRTQWWLTETKFRRTWDNKTRDELLKALKEQAKHWSPFYLILFLGRPQPGDSSDPSAWIRAVELSWHNDDQDLWIETATPKKWRDCGWEDLDHIQEVFSPLNDQACWDNGLLELTLIVSKGLVALQDQDQRKKPKPAVSQT